RAKLFGFDFSSAEWRECGIGEVQLLQHRKTKKVRVLMRRDKTLKVCVNHYITSDMRLQPNVGSDRSWVWKVAVDISDGEPVTVALALRFASKQVSDEFKLAFERAQALASAYSTNLQENNLRDKGENNLKEKEETNSTVERGENNSKDRVEMAGDENVLAKNHAKFFKFNTSNVEWKACGTGEVELLQHKETKKARMLMRRNKTLAIFANHYITSDMKLLPNVGSDRAWV
ncbi:hypothetical protein FRC07_009513, partial [Ceratobasidium sp. 392]